MELTDQDIELLLEGLEAIRQARSLSSMSAVMLGGMLAPDKEARDKILDDFKRKDERQQKDNKIMDERVIMLKAKLVQIRQSLAAERLVS